MGHLLALDSAETAALSGRLKDVVAPTAIVWGQHDPFLPVSLGRRLHEAIPRSTFDVLPNVRHFTPEEAPGKVAEILAALLRR
jgi:pimeloyl-ACP methyl ester carboxylesterase